MLYDESKHNILALPAKSSYRQRTLLLMSLLDEAGTSSSPQHVCKFAASSSAEIQKCSGCEESWQRFLE
jgi:hypothetical protein